VKDPIAGTRNDLILASSSDVKILLWCNKGYKPEMFSWVTYFEIGAGFDSAVARFSTWDGRSIADNRIVDKIRGSSAKLICLHTKRRVLSAVYKKD